MNDRKSVVGKKRRDPYRITKEQLSGTNTDLTSFFFRSGGNIYVLSYYKEGVIKHTFIDTGDPRHRNHILAILAENGIDPANTERIIITHRHVDHSGLAEIIAEASHAEILVHSGFRSFIDGELDPQERIWFGDFQAANLKKYDVKYLQPGSLTPVKISGVDFPRLSNPIRISGNGKLYLLGCPESNTTHSPDQLFVIYSIRSDPFHKEKDKDKYLPTDDIIFAGDLWLMNGPFHHLDINDIPRLIKFWIMRALFVNHRRNHREQDFAAKEALKRGFCLIRVNPGHGDEFLGSRIIPDSLLADRDILFELGYHSEVDSSKLQDNDFIIKVAAIKEKTYSAFVAELTNWFNLGYTDNEISRLLVRIYLEQTGGSKLVKRDRKQRRLVLKEHLTKLSTDIDKDELLRSLAQFTIREIKNL